jgi:hypothetical protein
VSNQTVLNLFGSVQAVAAATFARHVPDLCAVAEAASKEPPLVGLQRVLTRLAGHVRAEPEPARALLTERIAAKLHLGNGPGEYDIRLEVPIITAVLPAVERLDLDGEQPAHMVAALIDTVISLALDRTRSPEDAADVALRLLPRGSG